jgi:opacity protein-like surface antigen
VFSPGATGHGGLNVGAGVQHDISPSFAVEGVYNFHNIFTSGSSTQFSGVQGGVRFRF